MQKKRTPTKKYFLKKSPFNCAIVKPGMPGLCVAIPHKYHTYELHVYYHTVELLVVPIGEWSKLAIAHRHQPDKYGGGTFLMSYFKVASPELTGDVGIAKTLQNGAKVNYVPVPQQQPLL